MAKKKKNEEKEPKEKVVVNADTNLHSLIQSTFYKSFGEGSIMALSQDVTSSVTEWIPTGSYMLDDWISGGRGLPIGKIVTINGKKASGKSTIAASVLAGAQRAGAIAVLLDTEYAFDKVRAAVIGVDPDSLLIAQPDYMEMVFMQIEKLIEIAKAANKLLVIVWDSIAATPTQGEVDGEKIGDGGHYGEHSKILSAGYRKIVNLIAHNRVLFFQVNQIKTNINAGLYQSDVTYMGKNPIDFHSHVMIEIVEGSKIKDSNDNIIGIESNVFISKNRVAAPFKRGQLHILFDRGLHRGWEALEIGKKYGRCRLEGSWNMICKECSDCAGKGCATCKQFGTVQDERFKKFYTSNIDDILMENYGLETYLVTGHWPEVKEAA